jgi:hypothetical protein
MAQIDIQEKQGQPMWVWIAAIVALLVVGGVIWALMRNGDDRDDARMHQDTVPWRDTVPAAPRTPTSGIERTDDAVLAYLVFSEEPVRVDLSR